MQPTAALYDLWQYAGREKQHQPMWYHVTKWWWGHRDIHVYVYG